MQTILESVARAALEVAKVSEATGEGRLAICRECDQFLPKYAQCKVCGCFLKVKAFCAENINPTKLRVETTHCQLGKWGDQAVANFYREMDGIELLK